MTFDQEIYEWLTLYANPPWIQNLSEAVGDLRNFLVPIAILLILYCIRDRSACLKFLAILLTLLVCSEGSNYLLKHWIARPRPAVDWLIYVDPKALGFPSAHATNTMALAIFLSWWFQKSLLYFLPLPVIMGVSRVLANYHYPLDVMGGWILGAVISVLLVALAQKVLPVRWLSARL